MAKLISKRQAINLIQDSSTIMVGGFLGCGTPHSLIDALVEKGTKNLTLISNDTSMPDYGVGKLVVSKQLNKVITSHIGTNPETYRQMNQGELEVELVPQGTLAEQIRCGGAGLGGVLTQTGMDTVVEKGKQKITVGDRTYLLELPLKADISLLAGSVVDLEGNVYYEKTTRNFNPHMAMAANTVIVEAEELVKVGDIDPNHVMTPGIFVDYIVQGDS